MFVGDIVVPRSCVSFSFRHEVCASLPLSFPTPPTSIVTRREGSTVFLKTPQSSHSLSFFHSFSSYFFFFKRIEPPTRPPPSTHPPIFFKPSSQDPPPFSHPLLPPPYPRGVPRGPPLFGDKKREGGTTGQKRPKRVTRSKKKIWPISDFRAKSFPSPPECHTSVRPTSQEQKKNEKNEKQGGWDGDRPRS